MKKRPRHPKPTFEEGNIRQSFAQLHFDSDIDFILESNERVNGFLVENGYALSQIIVRDDLGHSSMSFPEGLKLPPVSEFSCGNSTVFHYVKIVDGNRINFEMDWRRTTHSYMVCEMVGGKKLSPTDSYITIKIQNIYSSQLTVENLKMWETILINAKKPIN